MRTMEPFDDHRLSEILVETMKVKGFTVSKLSETTGISERIIELLLSERFEELPPAPYVRGYLLRIAEALGADGGALWNAYGKFHPEIRSAGRADKLPKNRFALPRFSRKFIVGTVLTILIAGFIASRFIWGGKTFTFEVNIPDNFVTATSTYLLEGRVRAGDQLTLNNVALTLNLNGTFSREWELAPGWNTLRFMVLRPLEGEREFVKQIFYEVATDSPAKP